MKKTAGTTHVVVDGSNIATEGRSTPSLSQLNDAVLAYVAQHPNTLVTVVVDATFGHRIDRSERAEFDAAIANNELVAPPAGAIGRGDAFILGVADKAGAVVLSNDSFQEFHGQYPWLFDPGRLIGGKPVPHVGWVFVERMPVRGPISRRSRAAAPIAPEQPVTSGTRSAGKSGAKATAKPAARPTGRSSAKSAVSSATVRPVPVPKVAPPRVSTDVPVRAVNDIVAFLDFAERHATGSRLTAVVHSYASHGAYVSCDAVKCYVPLRLMGSPPPSRAREVMSIGDNVEIEIVEFAPVRRSIDCALVRVVERRDARSTTAARRGGGDKGTGDTVAPPKMPAKSSGSTTAGKKSASGRAASKKSAPKPSAMRTAAMRTPTTKPSTTKPSASKTAAVKTPTTKTAATKTAAMKKLASTKATSKKSATKKSASKRPASKQPVATKVAAKKAAGRPSSRRRKVSGS